MTTVLDFGIAKLLAEGGGGVTGSGQILGTPIYMAPEQINARMSVTPATDRYALGMVAYRLLAGETYYQGHLLGIIAQVLHAPLQSPSQRHPALGSGFDTWFLRACDRDPDKRFATADAQVETLAAALALS